MRVLQGVHEMNSFVVYQKYMSKNKNKLYHFDLFDRFAETWENQRRGTQKIRKG